ncbi:hypothetical protein FQN53_005573 [Emmonsiellopsis sp. PD_33]|nr:hypothetical protein FQN53_005573 [Emmonsiellopsis sp. PD_33]KAK2803021.1 hypothetical protein FQN51_004048 [Onygenales sp. PD_10]
MSKRLAPGSIKSQTHSPRPVRAIASGTYGGTVNLSLGDEVVGSFTSSNHHPVPTDLRKDVRGTGLWNPITTPRRPRVSRRLQGTTGHLKTLKSKLEGSPGQVGLQDHVEMDEE